MLEFLKECNSNNLYERAMDCERNIRSFNSILPMAVFFEIALKLIYAEVHPQLSEKNIDRMQLFVLHQDAALTSCLEDKYGFIDKDRTVSSIIRRRSNAGKHSINADAASPEEIRKCFRCLFDFAACYYAVKSGKPAPRWDDGAYQTLLDTAIDAGARSKHILAYESQIAQLQDELSRSKAKDIACAKEIETLREQLTAQIFENTDQEQLDLQQARIRALETQLDGSESQRIRLTARLEKLESEKRRADLELTRVRRQAERSGKEQAEELQQKQALFTERLRIAGESIEQLDQQNRLLLVQISAVSKEREAAQQALYELGRQSADKRKVARLERQLEQMQADRKQSQDQLQDVRRRLADAENQLFVAKDELSRINQEYLSVRKAQAMLGAAEVPRCPKCGSAMALRTGRNGVFWGCTAYPQCKGTSSAERSVVEQYQALEKRQDQLAKVRPPRKARETPQVEFKAYPASFANMTPTAYLFQSIAVPREVFPDRDALGLRYFSQFQMCSTMERSEVPAVERTVYSLALRLLNRGIVVASGKWAASLLREKFNRKDIGSANALFDYIHYDHPENPYGSGLEQAFAEYWFPQLLGSSWATYVIAQAGFDTLAPDEPRFAGQRADFLVIKNGRRIVVELDGPEHDLARSHDQDRNTVLERHGIQVLRFSNEAVKRRDPQILEDLRSALGKDRTAVKDIEFDDRYLVACKLAHQFEIAIVKALEQGYVPKKCSLRANVSTDLFSDAEVQFILTVAEEEVRRILENYAALYGLEAEWDFAEDGACAVRIQVGDGGGYRDRNSITLRDCYLMDDYQCDIAPFDSSVLPQNCALENMEFFLEYLFGYPHFREGQYDAICRLLQRKDSIILLPTGAGKSIIYQLSSFLAPGMIVVISPLKALIEDQVLNLQWKHGICCAVPLMSDTADRNRASQEEQLLRMQHNATSLLYIAPERLTIPSFRNALPGMMSQNFVFAVAIDEAHCVSEWGHDFRPAYLNIGQSTRNLFHKGGYIPSLIALTGTASDAVLRDVQRELQITQPDARILPDTFDRPELHFRVIQCPSTDKGIHIAEIIKKDLPKSFGRSYEDFIRMDGSRTNAGIVFTPLTSWSALGQYDAVSIQLQLSEMLPEAGIAAYFSKTPKEYSDETWRATITANAARFKKNELNLLVATKAFGMGIDKENIRYIIHNGIPSSFEAYYQEAGRAGRDGDQSECVLLFSVSDGEQNEELLSSTITLGEFTEKYSRYSSKDVPASKRDDLSTILYFHTSSYKGVDDECRSVNAIIGQLPDETFQPGHKVSFYVSSGSQDKRDPCEDWRRALVRLYVLGVISDYTDDHRGNFVLTLGSIQREDIIENYAAYVSWNSQGRTAQERQKLERTDKSGLAFVKEAVHALVEYIYDNIEQSRRRAIREMYMTAKEAAALPPEEQDLFFRQRILNYFSYKGEQRGSLQGMLTASHAGLPVFSNLFPAAAEREAFSEEERQRAAGLNVAAGRMLESNPDHPGLLLVQTAAEIITGDQSGNVIANDAAAAVQYALERYAVPGDILLPAVRQVLDLALTSSVELFDRVLDSTTRAGLDRAQVVEGMVSSDQVSDTNRMYLLYSYALDRANDFLTGGSRHDGD